MFKQGSLLLASVYVSILVFLFSFGLFRLSFGQTIHVRYLSSIPQRSDPRAFPFYIL